MVLEIGAVVHALRPLEQGHGRLRLAIDGGDWDRGLAGAEVLVHHGVGVLIQQLGEPLPRLNTGVHFGVSETDAENIVVGVLGELRSAETRVWVEGGGGRREMKRLEV